MSVKKEHQTPKGKGLERRELSDEELEQVVGGTEGSYWSVRTTQPRPRP